MPAAGSRIAVCIDWQLFAGGSEAFATKTAAYDDASIAGSSVVLRYVRQLLSLYLTVTRSITLHRSSVVLFFEAITVVARLEGELFMQICTESFPSSLATIVAALGDSLSDKRLLFNNALLCQVRPVFIRGASTVTLLSN